MTIVNRLNELISERKLVKKELAASIGVPQSTLQTWLDRGEDFPARYIVPLCNVLKISTDKLLSGIDTPLPEIPKDYVQLSEDERYLLDTMRGLDREGVVLVTSKAVEEARRVRAGQGNGAADGRVG